VIDAFMFFGRISWCVDGGWCADVPMGGKTAKHHLFIRDVFVPFFIRKRGVLVSVF
jgi:hypothetical protein